MAKEPSLIRRPVVIAGGRVVLGFDEKGMATSSPASSVYLADTHSDWAQRPC